LRARLTALAGEKLAGDSGEKEIRQKLAALDTEVLAAEAELSARGESGVNDELMRVEQLRERARGLAAVLAERRRSMERDQGQLIADDVVAALEADAAQMREELIEVERSLAIAMQENDSLLEEEETFERERTEQGLFHMVQSNEASNAAAEVRGELRTLRNTVEQGAGEAQKMQARTEQLIAHDANVAAGIDRLQSELADAETEVGSLRAQLVDVTDTREQIELLGDEAQVARAAAERRSARAAAKLEALEEAVASSRARIGAEHLANVSGVVGALVDLLEVDAGWDAAVKASLGEALASIVVSDSTSARRAIEALQAVDHNGAVLALGISQNSSASLPSGVQSVRSHVRPASGAPAALAALLDSLLSHIG
jgi:chromosome segregation protein